MEQAAAIVFLLPFGFFAIALFPLIVSLARQARGVNLGFRMGLIVGGTWGALATGLFVTVGGTGLVTGLINGDGLEGLGQFMAQVYAVTATAAYSFIVTYALVKILDSTMGFRVSDESEVVGLDQTEHGEVGYTL